MLTLGSSLNWAWAWFWWLWWQVFDPLWKLPLRLGVDMNVDEFKAWGDVLGIGFAINQSVPVVQLLASRERNCGNE